MKVYSDNTSSIETDLLGRNNIALEITNGLVAYSKKNKDGLSVSITGEWGSGKSTLLNFIKNHLEQKQADTFKIISFNPWLFYKHEGIREAFLIHFALSLKDFETRATNVSLKLNEFLKAFRWIKYISGTAGNIQESLESLTEHLGEKANVHDIKEEIETILKKSKKKIIVFIDDVDRLSQDQITELFQTITLVANFSNVIYIVAFDREIVCKSIGKNFNGKGQEYLEKVIQVDYEIPSIPDQKLEHLFFSNIANISKETKIKFEAYALKSLWGYHGLKDYFKSIRDFKRFFNALSFRFLAIIDDINPIDFIAIEAIRIFDYRSYSKFYTYYKYNARKRELPVEGLDEEQFKELGSTASEILRSLSDKSTIHWHRKEANLKRLLDPEYFDRYFNLMRSDNDISEKDLREIITRPNVRKGILNEALIHNRIENLVKRLADTSLHKIFKEYDYALIRDIIEFFNQHSDTFETYNYRVADMLINLICGNKKRYTEFISTFFKSFGTNYRPASIIHIYFFHFIRMFVHDGRNFRSDHRIFDEYYKKHYNFIEGQYLPRFREATNFMWESRQTVLCPFMKYLFQRNYAELFPSDYETIFDPFTNDKDYVLYLAGRIAEVDKGDLTLQRYMWVEQDPVFPGNTFNKLYAKLEAMQEESLNDYQRTVRRHLLRLDISEFPKIKYPPESDTETD